MIRCCVTNSWIEIFEESAGDSSQLVANIHVPQFIPKDRPEDAVECLGNNLEMRRIWIQRGLAIGINDSFTKCGDAMSCASFRSESEDTVRQTVFLGCVIAVSLGSLVVVIRFYRMDSQSLNNVESNYLSII